MPKPWAEVAQSEEFKRLPWDDRVRAREQYFSDVVAPQITDPKDLFNAKAQFVTATKESIAGAVDPALVAKSMEQSPLSRFAQGAGKRVWDYVKGVEQIGAGINQTIGFGIPGTEARLRQEEAVRRAQDAPLMATTAGQAGQLAGDIGLAAVPALGAARLGAMATMPRSLATGAGLGAGLAGGQALTPEESRAKEAALGAGIGLVGSGLGEGLGAVIRATARPFKNMNTAAREALVAKAEDMGFKLLPSQQTNNKALELLEQATETVTGGGKIADIRRAHQTVVNRALSQEMGIPATDEITTDTIEAARRLNSGLFDTATVGQSVTFDNRLLAKLADAKLRLSQGLAATGRLGRKPGQIISELADKPGVTGEQYQAFRSEISDLSREATRAGRVNQAKAFDDIVKALDGAADRSLPPENLAMLRQAREQWGAMRTIEKAIDPAAPGDISVAKLKSAVASRKLAKGNRANTTGVEDISNIMQAIKVKTPTSGTSERSFWIKALSNPFAAAGALTGGVPGWIGAQAATRGAERLLTSPGGQRYLTQGIGTQVADPLAGYLRALSAPSGGFGYQRER